MDAPGATSGNFLFDTTWQIVQLYLFSGQNLGGSIEPLEPPWLRACAVLLEIFTGAKNGSPLPSQNLSLEQNFVNK